MFTPSPTRGCGCSTIRRANCSRSGTASTPPTMARTRAEIVRALQQRRFRLVRVARRPGDDQPSRRRRLPAEAQHTRTRPDQDGFHARTPAEELKCVDLELNVLMSIEDVTDRVNAAVPDRTPIRPRSKGPASGHEHDREESLEQDRPAQRRGHALPGRPVSSLPLQEIHRRATGLRSGEGHRLFRRRSGQFRISALRSRRLLLPRLRRRQAGQDRALSDVEPQRRQRQRVDLRLRASGPDRPAEHRWPTWISCETWCFRSRSTTFAAAR